MNNFQLNAILIPSHSKQQGRPTGQTFDIFKYLALEIIQKSCQLFKQNLSKHLFIFIYHPVLHKK